MVGRWLGGWLVGCCACCSFAGQRMRRGGFRGEGVVGWLGGGGGGREEEAAQAVAVVVHVKHAG